MTNTMQLDVTARSAVPAERTARTPVVSGPATAPPAGLSHRPIVSAVRGIRRAIAAFVHETAAHSEVNMPPSIQLMVGPNGGPIWTTTQLEQNGSSHDRIDRRH